MNYSATRVKRLKATVSQWLAQQDKELKIVAFKRFTLVAE